MENLNKSDKFRLINFEKWATYALSTGAISIESVITADGGKNFSTLLSEEDMFLASFNMKDIPEADVLLLWGENLQTARYGAEIAVRYKQKYGSYPAFVTSGGDFVLGKKAGKTQAECYEHIMLKLGFPQDWVMRYHTDRKVICAVSDIHQKLKQVPHQNKLRVLAVTSAGYSLLAAQELVPLCPEVDFCFFETPSTNLDKRFGACERFEPDGYGVDLLIANLFRLLMRGSGIHHLPLSAEKLLTAPTKRDLKHFLDKGYARFCNDPEMWQYVKIHPHEGNRRYLQRRQYLESLPKNEKREAADLKRLTLSIKTRLDKFGLTVA